jgi:hypothetical protein
MVNITLRNLLQRKQRNLIITGRKCGRQNNFIDNEKLQCGYEKIQRSNMKGGLIIEERE